MLDLTSNLATSTLTQINELLQKLELKEEDMKTRIIICSVVRDVFVKAGYSHCLVHPYGSTINGCGFQSSDLDLYVELGDGGLTTSSVTYLSHLLLSCEELQDITPIPCARVPIVKAVHKETGIRLDLSFNNQTSLWNTELIRYFCGVDPRVRPLVMVIRYWAMEKRITQIQNGKVKLCNYALTMMVIAYLQQLKQPLLPSLERILNLKICDSSNILKIIHNYSFESQENKSSLLDLLIGFFSHYNNFTCNHQVVSVYHGRTLPRTNIKQLIRSMKKKHPELFTDKKAMGSRFQSDCSICLIDPFEPWFNMARGVSTQGYTILQTELNLTAKGINSYNRDYSPVNLLSISEYTPTELQRTELLKEDEENHDTISFKYNPPKHNVTSMAIFYCSMLVSQKEYLQMPPWWLKWKLKQIEIITRKKIQSW